MKNLTESGLQKNDLDYLIMPMLDIDNYESKIDNSKAIVVAFYVFEEDPARDLERFIEKGNIDILDAETSPAPTEDGYYVVFIEMDRDRDFPESLIDLVYQIDNLSNVEQWQFKTLHDDEMYDLTKDNLSKHVNLDPSKVPPAPDDAEEELKDKKIEKQSEEEPAEEPAAEETPVEDEITAESAVPLLRNGLMEHIEARGDMIAIRSSSSTLIYKVTMISESEPSVPITGFEIGNPLIRESAMLSSMLGPRYAVNVIDNGLLVECEDGYLILETVD